MLPAQAARHTLGYCGDSEAFRRDSPLMALPHMQVGSLDVARGAGGVE